MENASKALMFAGTVLITLMVISAVVFMYRDLTSVKRQDAENQKVEETAEFNKTFESYEKELKGTQLFSLSNKIIDYNEKYAGKDGYEEITLTVHTDRGNKNATYYTELQTNIDEIMEIYESSNYLEALGEAYEVKNSSTASKSEKEQAELTIKEIGNKIGQNNVNNSQRIISNLNKYQTYKNLKTKTFKSEGITYYKNGRIESMTFTQK